MGRKAFFHDRPFLIFLIVPAVVLTATILFKSVTGPFWLAMNLDPAYQYLINGVYLIKGLVPNHVDHPGTPLQMLCGLVCWLFNAGRPVPEIITRVLLEPEFYLQAVSWVLMAGYFLTSVAVAVVVHKMTKDRIAAVMSQMPGLLVLSFPMGGTVVGVSVAPEPLMMIMTALFSLGLLRYFFAGTPQDEFRAVIWWGIVCGIALAVKLNFLPLLLVPLVVMPWKQKGLFCITAAALFFGVTLPILSKYDYLWQWFSGLVTHTGVHGAGGFGIIRVTDLFRAMLGIAQQQWFFAAMILGALALVLVRALQKKWERGDLFLLAVALGIFLQLATVAKYSLPHYLVPGFGALGGLFVFFYLQGPARSARGRFLTGIFITVLVTLGTAQAVAYSRKVGDVNREMMMFHAKVHEKYADCRFLGFYRSSGKEAALFFGDSWNLVSSLGEELNALYPDTYFFHVWGHAVLDFKHRILSDDILAGSSCVIFQGSRDFDFSQGPFTMQLMEEGSCEAVYRMTATIEGRAVDAYLEAVRLAKAGERRKALLYALNAKANRYQPSESVDSLIRVLLAALQR